MAIDPRIFFTTKICAKSRQDGINIQGQKKGIFDAVGKIGDLEVLNDIGGGAIGEGLRTLSRTADSIRDGENAGAVASVLGDIKQSLESGANVVLGTVGINPNVVQQVANFNSGVANRGLGQAKQVYEKVVNGDFNISDIPDRIQDFQNLGQFAEKLFFGKSGKNSASQREICDASPYAIDLTGAFSPKYKFLFLVQFIFNEGFSAEFDQHGKGLTHVIKTATRPTVNFEYEEVNMYNFRTKFPKRSEYQPQTMTFYDDNQNQGMQFYKKYLEIMVPNSKIGQESINLYEENGMNFTDGNVNSASLQAVHRGHNTILRNIRLFHIYNYGKNMNVYNYFNPKLLEMSLDDLDMAESGPTEISLQFTFDGLNIQTSENNKPLSMNSEMFNIEDLTSSGQYPLTFNGDINDVSTLAGPVNDLNSEFSQQSFKTTTGENKVDRQINKTISSTSG